MTNREKVSLLFLISSTQAAYTLRFDNPIIATIIICVMTISGFIFLTEPKKETP